MSKQSNHNRVERVMDSLQGIRKASPQPFLFTRVKARLERQEKNFWEKTGVFLARPSVAFATLLMVLSFNTLFIVRKEKATKVAAVVQSETIQDDDFILADNTTSYDFVNADQ